MIRPIARRFEKATNSGSLSLNSLWACSKRDRTEVGRPSSVPVSNGGMRVAVSFLSLGVSTKTNLRIELIGLHPGSAKTSNVRIKYLLMDGNGIVARRYCSIYGNGVLCAS